MPNMLAVLALLIAAPQARDCTDDRGTDRCTAQALAAQRARYGLPPIEELTGARAQVMRALFVDGYGREVVAVSFLREAGREPRVEVRSGAATAEGMTAAVPATMWEALTNDGRHFDRVLAPAGGDAPICLHSWMTTVEAADATGVRRRTEDSCSGALAIAHADRLAQAAVTLLPACALLDPQRHRNAAARLARCTNLAGDRMAAAQAFNRFSSDAFSDPKGQPIRHLFTEDAELAWPGGPAVRGSGPAADAWARQTPGQRFWVGRIVGETAERVRIEGWIETGAPDRPERVAMVQTWVRTNGDDFRLRLFGPLPR